MVDFVNRYSTTGWDSTVAGTGIEDYVETSSILFPVIGQTITYTIAVPLVISLKDISAVNVGSSNKTSWSSAHEDVGDKYVLEHSADGKSFRHLADVNGKGEDGNYVYID